MAAIIYTNFTTAEYPPDDLDEFNREKSESGGLLNGLLEILSAIKNMPRTMMEIAVVQLFTWFALFAMWSNSTPAITAHVFHTTDTTSSAYNTGANLRGYLFCSV